MEKIQIANETQYGTGLEKIIGRKIRDTLHIRDEEYRIVLEHCNTIVYRYDLSDHTLFMPKELADRFKLPSILKNVPFSAIEGGYIAKESIPAYMDFYDAVEKGIEGEKTEIKRKIGDGSYRWYQGEYTIIRDNNRVPVSAIMIYRDITDKKFLKSEMQTLKKSEEILKLAARQQERHLIGYNISQDTIEPMDSVTRAFFARVPNENFSEKLMTSGIVSRESEKKVEEALRKIKNGYRNGDFYVKAKDVAGYWQWYKCHFSVNVDEDGKISFAVIEFKYVTALHNKEITWKLYLSQHSENHVRKVFERLYNLTLNMREKFDNNLESAPSERTNILFDKSVEFFAQKYILRSDRESFLQFLSRDRLLLSFSDGIKMGTQEFCMLLPAQRIRWVKISYQMFSDPYSENVKILIFCKDITKEKTETERLMHITQYDPVTDTYNRAQFEQCVIKRSQMAEQDMLQAFVLIDIDDFKNINSQFGHLCGDKILRNMAHTISSVIFKDDIIGRIGGDAFAISMYGFKNKVKLAEKVEIIRRSIAVKINDNTSLTASIGVSVSPLNGKTFEELYKKADAAQFHSKMLGGNCVTFYERGMQDRLEKMPAGQIRNEMNLSSCEAADTKVYIRTFGYFDVFVDGKAIPFQYAKTKELLALLVDRRGGFVTSEEIVGCLWENESANKITLSRSRKVALHLKNTLKEYGIENIMETKKGARRILPEKVQCDLYQYLSGDKRYKNLFRGSYMSNYSWGEIMLADLQPNK